MVQAPRCALREWEKSIEFCEELRIREVEISRPCAAAERPAGQISHFVVAPSDGPWCQWGALGDHVPQRQGSDQALAHQGVLGREAPGPGDGGGVVAPGSSMFVLKGWGDALEHKPLEDEAGHFQVIDGEVPGWVPG